MVFEPEGWLLFGSTSCICRDGGLERERKTLLGPVELALEVSGTDILRSGEKEIGCMMPSCERLGSNGREELDMGFCSDSEAGGLLGDWVLMVGQTNVEMPEGGRPDGGSAPGNAEL